MKKVMMMLMVLVCVMMLGACGSADGFVRTGYYQDELINTGADHKPLKKNKDEIMLDADRGVYAIGQMKDGKLVYTVYYGYITVDELEFERSYRKRDDQSRVKIVRKDGSEDVVCYKGTQLFKNVLTTELNKYR